MPLLFGVSDNGRCVLRIQSIQNVEEVNTVNTSAARHVIREELPELSVGGHLRTNILQRQLIVQWNVYPLYLVKPK